MASTTVTIKSYERVFFCGRTGSGKTFAAKHICARLPRLVVLDPKGTLTDWNLEPWDRETRRLLRQGYPVRARVVVPFGADATEIWEEAFYAVYSGGNCTLYIDEVYGVVEPGSKPPSGLTAIWTRGRELKVGGFASSQRPTWVPLFILSEADHLFTFRLSLEEDRRRMAAFMGPEVEGVIRDLHGVYYSHATWDRPLYVPELPFRVPAPAPRTPGVTPLAQPAKVG
jgi:DNA helicase HerA-like ATPase